MYFIQQTDISRDHLANGRVREHQLSPTHAISGFVLSVGKLGGFAVDIHSESCCVRVIRSPQQRGSAASQQCSTTTLPQWLTESINVAFSALTQRKMDRRTTIKRSLNGMSKPKVDVYNDISGRNSVGLWKCGKTTCKVWERVYTPIRSGASMPCHHGFLSALLLSVR